MKTIPIILLCVLPLVSCKPAKSLAVHSVEPVKEEKSLSPEEVRAIMDEGIKTPEEIERIKQDIIAANRLQDATDKADAAERDNVDAAEIRAWKKSRGE